MPRKAKSAQEPEAPTKSKNSFSQNRETLGQMAAIASSFKSWRPATEVLTSVEAVPTIFPQIDVLTKIMGWPISRFSLVHGPSSEGKSTFIIGLMRSFLMRGHFVGFADAERTTPPEWLQSLMGEYLGHPGFQALPVRSYEQTVDSVREFCETIAEAREKGRLDQETTGIVCVDSIRKLVPKKLMATLLKEGADGKKGSRGVDGFGGRAAQVKAALNSSWMDELVPLLADTRMAMAVISRETEDPDADFYSDDFKVGGGKALVYDSSLVLRVQRSFLKDTEDPKKVFGERHRVEIRKTKVAGKETKRPTAHFHTSNGTASPAGFDRARDVLELAKEQGVITLTGSSYNFGDDLLGRGELKTLVRLREDLDLLGEIELASRNKAAASW